MTKKEQIIRDYLGGMSAPELAEKYNRTRGGIETSLWQWRIKLPPEERARRRAANFGNTLAPIRQPIWPDCPEHLKEDYETLRRYMPAREARARLEGNS